MLVHLTAEKNVKRILRNGISRARKKPSSPYGIFAMPVTRNFYVSHQWLRELKRRGQGPIAAVYFRIPDDEDVWVGHYNRSHQKMRAASALALIAQQSSAEGYEVIVPRKVMHSQVHRVKRLPQVIGWRYYPDSHGKRPCGCPFCQRGNYGARKLREAFEKT
ncbi:MAG TPA: hypothetical protein VI685_10425 [Candidatus Angelobacter sp.]